MESQEQKVHLLKMPPGRYGNVLFIADDFFNSLGLKSGEVVQIQAGLVKVSAKVYPSSIGKVQDNRFYLGNYDKNSRFPTNCKLSLRLEQGQKLFRVGPLMGIFTYRDDFGSNHPSSPFGPQSGSFKNITLTGAKLNALVYVFTPADINWEKKTIKARIYIVEKGKGKWETRNFPFPDIVYDRIPTRKDEGRPEVRLAKERLQAITYIKYFNPQFLNKWVTYRALVDSKAMTKHVPETTLYENVGSITQMLKAHNRVYLKPTASSIGKGIVEITWLDEGFQCRFRQVQSNLTKVLNTVEELKEFAENWVGQKPFLVQRGIDLARYQDRPFDVRALVQKTIDGSWVVTGMAARVAGVGSITTHVPNGGSAESLELVIKEVFGQDITRNSGIGAELRKVALLAPPLIEEYLQKNFAELSMDLGIDKKGHIWLIEANSKPFRFDEKVIRLQSWVTIINYAKKVAGFGEVKETISKEVEGKKRIRRRGEYLFNPKRKGQL